MVIVMKIKHLLIFLLLLLWINVLLKNTYSIYLCNFLFIVLTFYLSNNINIISLGLGKTRKEIKLSFLKDYLLINVLFIILNVINYLFIYLINENFLMSLNKILFIYLYTNLISLILLVLKANFKNKIIFIISLFITILAIVLIIIYKSTIISLIILIINIIILYILRLFIRNNGYIS